uniref:MHC class I-like antigen recognition-like domain-containing protein n=1 Tax=Gouania willdenowi TaxID=441366 RepID=A0A8C5GTR7_GOUWI
THPCAEQTIIIVEPLLHTLRYFSTASSDVPNFPEFVFVGYVDDVQIIHYDSNSRTAYWEEQTGKLMGSQKSEAVNTWLKLACLGDPLS